jgi:hypothetical protein
MANEIQKFTYFFYKLSIDNMCYVGSTINIKKRMSDHKSHCYNIKSTNYNYKLYKYIRENSCWDNINMQILDVIDNITKNEAIVFEQQFIDYFENTLNAIRAYTTPEQLKEYKQQYQKQYTKQYQHDNKEQLKEYRKQYQHDNKEQIKEYKKQYYENNKEQIKQYQKQYQKQYTKQKVKCDYCNKEMNRSSLNNHKKKNCKKNKK